MLFSIILNYFTTDCKELSELFYNTVHTVNAKDYTKEQLDVWATGTVDLEKWNQLFKEHYTVVAVDGEIIIGFGDIDKTGYPDRLFVHKDYQGNGNGVATAICDKLEQAAQGELSPMLLLQQDLSLKKEITRLSKSNKLGDKKLYLLILL